MVTNDTELEARAKLCGSYVTYVRVSKKPIDALDKVCWRDEADQSR